VIPSTNPPRPSLLTDDVERTIRNKLSGSTGAVYVRFQVSAGALSVEILDRKPTEPETPAVDAGPTVPFSAWLHAVLRTEHISQEAAARRLGVSLKTVNRWVNGRTEPRMRELRRIQGAFGVAPPL